MKLISLFTGCGGLDLGFEAAGFDTRVAVEMQRDAAATLRANRAWPVIERDIRHVATEELLEVAGLAVGEADVLVGGPPCQPFSKSGYWATGDSRRLDDPRASTLDAYLRILRAAQPKAFLLENVAGLAYRRKSEGIDYLRRAVDAINREFGLAYTFEIALLNAAHYGVPQTRERVFVIGHRGGVDFRFPAPTHHLSGEPAARHDGRRPEPFFNAWDAIGDLEEDDDPGLALRGRWADLLPSIPEGKNYLHHTDRGEGSALFGWRRRYWSFLLKLAKDRPSWTLTAQPGSAIGPFHWKNRRLSRREMCRLQTFPDDLHVGGSRSEIQRQIGNAVPSALAELLALEIRRQLLGDRSTSKRPRKLLPLRRRPIPRPEPVATVATKYEALVARHPPHPGTGKGYRASATGTS